MLSCGMFSALAARIAPRKRGLLSGSPPPFFAAIEISFRRRVKILPRLASSAPFLCLIVAHFEWPDIGTSKALKMVVFFRHRTSDYTIGGVAGAKPYGGYSGRIFSCYGQLQSLLDD